MYKKFQQGGMMPPQPQMQQQGGLPPELQQILNSLPDDIKQYIMSLPIEQQIQELMKIAQGQVQAVQQSPNQMMQQGMNREQMRQPSMMKMGGRFQGGGRIGVNSIDNKPLEQPIGNVIPNYNYNTMPMAPKYSPAPQSPIKKGEVMRIDGKDRTVVSTTINGKEFVGYVDDNGVFKPINIGITTSGNTAPQGGVNRGNYNFGNQNVNQGNVSQTPPARITTTPKPVNFGVTSPAKPKRIVPSTSTNYQDAVAKNNPKPSPFGGNTTVYDPVITQKAPTKPNSSLTSDKESYDESDNMKSASRYKSSDELAYERKLTSLESELNKKQLEFDNYYKSIPSNNGRYSTILSFKQNEIQEIQNQIAKVRSHLRKESSKLDIYRGKKQQYGGNLYLSNNGVIGKAKHPRISEMPRNEKFNFSDNIQTWGQFYDKANKAFPHIKKQMEDDGYYFKKKTYALGGPTDEDLREEYLIRNKQAQRNQRQQNRLDRKIARRERLDQRRREGSVLDEFNEKRLGILQGRRAMKENQKFTNADKRDVAAQQLQNQTQFAVQPPGNYQVQTPAKINQNNQVNNPPANTTTVPTTNPTTNNNQGSQRIATKSGKKGLSSFEQAFADARRAQGPGGVFTWNGKQYTTDYKNEVGKGKSGQAQNPAQTPSQNPAQTPSQGQAQKLLNNPTLRQEAGEFGRGLMKVASYLDPGEWASHLAKKAGMDEKWANRLGTAVSVGSLFIPGLGIAGMIGKTGKLANMAAVSAKTLNAQKTAKAALNAAKAAAGAVPNATKQSIKAATTSQRAALNAANKAVNAEKMVTYGPKFGEAANRAQVAATNLAKKGIALAPGATQIGQGLDAYSEGKDKEALARVIGGTALGVVGGRRIGNINKTAKAREAQSQYRKINDKDYVLDKSGQWTLVNPSNAATNTAEAEILRKAGAKTLIPVSNSPGTFMDSAGNLYNKAGQLISKAGSSVKSGASNLATKVKNLRKTSSASSAPPTSPAPPTTPTTPRYGGRLNYQIGGTISMPGIKSKDKFTMPIYGSKDNHYPKISPGLIKFFEQNPSKKGSIAPPLFDKDNPNPYENNEPYFKSPGTMAFFDEERKKYKKQNAPALEFVKYGGKMRIKTCKYGC